jgi:hypothetical protein
VTSRGLGCGVSGSHRRLGAEPPGRKGVLRSGPRYSDHSGGDLFPISPG